MYMIMRTSREVKLLEVKCAACRLLKKDGPKICKCAFGLLPKIRKCAFGLLPKIRHCANGLLPKIRKCAIICCFMRTFAKFPGDLMRNWCVAYGTRTPTNYNCNYPNTYQLQLQISEHLPITIAIIRTPTNYNCEHLPITIAIIRTPINYNCNYMYPNTYQLLLQLSEHLPITIAIIRTLTNYNCNYSNTYQLQLQLLEHLPIAIAITKT